MAYIDLGKPFHRLFNFPLDGTSVFDEIIDEKLVLRNGDSYSLYSSCDELADAYSKLPISYLGQIFSVLDISNFENNKFYISYIIEEKSGIKVSSRISSVVSFNTNETCNEIPNT